MENSKMADDTLQPGQDEFSAAKERLQRQASTGNRQAIAELPAGQARALALEARGLGLPPLEGSKVRTS